MGNKRKSTKGMLINRAGKGRYCNPDAIEKVIKYIARANKPKDDMVCCGAFGAFDFLGIDTTIKQFECVQLLHQRKGKIKRYIDHEVYSFSVEEENRLRENNIPLETIAREMADVFYGEGFQVYYGIHKKNKDTNSLHIHFAVNTVNFKTKNKRHENKTETKKHEQMFQDIVWKNIQQPSAGA